MKIHKHGKHIKTINTVIESCLIVILIVLVAIMMVLIGKLQGTARVINYTGLVRGATQREVKLEITGNPNDELINYLDGILEDLKYKDGDYNLIKLDNNDYEKKLDTQTAFWILLKDEIYKVREYGYENTDIVDVLDISAFHGNAKSYVVHPDGRVVVDHSFKEWGNAYNFFGILREHSNIPEKEILELSGKFKAGDTDAMLVNLDGKNYYLVYEKSEIQDWVFLGLVKAEIVNASMNVLQRSTMMLVGIVVLSVAGLFIWLILRKSRVSLKKKDTEICFRSFP